MKLRLASLSLLALCLMLTAIPGIAQTLYSNGPINGSTNAWDIVNGFIVSDSFTLSGSSDATGFMLGVWNECEGCGQMTSLEWSMTSGPDGGTVYASGTATTSGGSGGLLASQFLYTNQFGYGIDEVTVLGLNVNFGTGGTYWLNLQNAQGGDGYFFWDQNSGVGCGGDNGMGGGCPSLAQDSGVGTIPSESFTILGTSSSTTSTSTTTTGTVPEPSSLVLFASGFFGLTAVLRRKLF
ncbi:MAG: PEP-CTERM sorting domain-containing protein [Candidatus Korobacteraceae bacterium]